MLFSHLVVPFSTSSLKRLSTADLVNDTVLVLGKYSNYNKKTTAIVVVLGTVMIIAQPSHLTVPPRQRPNRALVIGLTF